AELTLKAGGSFVKIDGSGVSVVGSKINLNSGGSAGSGSGYAGSAPLLPGAVEAAEKLNIVTPALRAKLLTAHAANVALTEICQKQQDGTCPLSDCPCGNHQ
ncbi:TPA: type VI secretion system tip protein VgrG, partial [Photobacterium damselae]